jgi:hypothetical protein
MTEQELIAEGLTNDQRVMYHEFFDAVNGSLDDLAKSEMYRSGRVLKLDKAPDNLNLKDTANWYANQLDEPNDQKQFINKYDAIAKLQKQGYAPLMRFGQYTLDVVSTNPDGSTKREFFGMFESPSEVNKAKRTMIEMYPNAKITSGIMSQKDWQMFKGVTPETMEIFARLMNVEQGDAFQEYLKHAVNNKSAMKRLIHRNKIEGFTSDPQRVLATFITSNAKTAAKNYHMGDMVDAIVNIPKEKGDVLDEAVDLYNYVQNPNEAGAKIRGWLFAWYLGGSPAAAMINLTQTLTTTLPYLSKFGSPGQVTKALTNAMRLATKPIDKISGDLRQALHLAEEEGVTAPHELHMLYGESMRTGFMTSPLLRPLSKAWGALFSVAESYNRRVAFIAAYNIAKENGETNLFKIAERAVIKTQFVYNKTARSNLARGTVGSMLMTFKTFSTNYIEFLIELPTRERTIALAVLITMAGLSGLPGADDIDDILDTLGQSLGYNTNSKEWKNEVITNMISYIVNDRSTGKSIANYIMNGVSAGLPMDISSRLSVGNLIPGSAVFKRSEIDKSYDVMEFIGPVGSLASRVKNAAMAVGSRGSIEGKIYAAGKAILPKALQDISQAIDMEQTGKYRNFKGANVVDVSTGDALVKALGFQPTKVSEPRKAERLFNQNVQMAKVTEDDIAALWAIGIVEKNKDKIREAKQMLVDWNKRNPDTPILIKTRQLVRRVRELKRTSAERLLKATPKELREYARKSIASANE